jgi:hypothetical protein
MPSVSPVYNSMHPVLVEEFAGVDGRLRFATTAEFLQRFGLASLVELTAALLASNQYATEPLI